MSLLFASAGAAAAPPQYNYLLHCGGCHLEDGSGMAGVVPDLNEHLDFFASIAEGRSYLIRVPGAAQSPLNDAELAELLNWMVARYAPDASPPLFTEAEVSQHRRVPLHDAPAARAALIEGRDAESTAEQKLTQAQQEAFGKLLFFDTSLSRHGNQACASCHDPGRAFSDPRPLSVSVGASLGSDNISVGQRNAPALTYVASTPVLTLHDPLNNESTITAADAIRGGFFLDGREATLQSQVLTPFVNEQEMALENLQELADQVKRSARYRDYVSTANQDANILSRIAGALAAYLSSDSLNRFDSRYDRFLRGEILPTREEVVGMGLFFSPTFTSCATCHQAKAVDYAPGEVFTNHRYENIGTPVNEALLSYNGLGSTFRDMGLGANPVVREAFDRTGLDSRLLNGRFKVSSLRNVAVTAPYMHNGVFDDLSTVMLFYNHFNETGGSGQINPETNQPWGDTANLNGVATDKLRSGFPLSPPQISALTAFLRMLTDQAYEHLLD